MYSKNLPLTLDKSEFMMDWIDLNHIIGWIDLNLISYYGLDWDEELAN
jgi:hypothetical protein